MPPRAGSSTRWRRRSGSRVRRARRGRAILPSGILAGQVHDQGTDTGGDRGSTRPLAGCGPAAADEVPMPARDRGRVTRNPRRRRAGSSRTRAASTARSVQLIRGRGCASPQHSKLMAQDKDLDLVGGVGAGVEHHPAQQLREHLVDQLHRHQRIIPPTLSAVKHQVRDSTRVSGTHKRHSGHRPAHHPGSRPRQHQIWRTDISSATTRGVRVRVQAVRRDEQLLLRPR